MNGYLIGRVRGVEIRVNWSVMIIAILIAVSLADSILPDIAEGHERVEYWIAGVLTAVAFFGGLLAHELGHALVAQREGVEVKGITLWLFGGVAMLGTNAKTPEAAMRIAIAGPVVSFALGVVGILLGLVATGVAGSALLWFGAMNFVLVAFNLLPAYPLDGGRVYQAWRWRQSGDELEAVEAAVRLGLIIGGVMVVVGVLEILAGFLVGGVWMVCIGWFLREAARSELLGRRVEESFAHLPVRSVMTPKPLTVRGDVTVENFIAGMFFGGRHAAYPVVDDKGDLTGLVTVNAIRALEGEDRMHRLVSDVSTPVADLVLVQADSSVSDLVRSTGLAGEARALVLEGDLLVGIVSPSDIARLMTVVDLAPRPHSIGPADVDLRTTTDDEISA